MSRSSRSVLRFCLSEAASFLGLLLNPLFLMQVVRQLLGQVRVCVRALFASRREALPWCHLQLPFEGRWKVVRGGLEPRTSHSWDLLSQRYAYDFLVEDAQGQSSGARPRALSDYYAWGRKVHSPVAGLVVRVEDRWDDNPAGARYRLPLICRSLLGNHVLVRQEPGGMHVLLAHLQRGSCVHRPGQRVAVGEVLGRCGNSGMSTEPHVHLQAQDGEDFFAARGLPIAFSRTAVTPLQDGPRSWPGDVRGGDTVQALSSGAPGEGSDSTPPPIAQSRLVGTLLATVLALLALVAGVTSLYVQVAVYLSGLWPRTLS